MLKLRHDGWRQKKTFRFWEKCLENAHGLLMGRYLLLLLASIPTIFLHLLHAELIIFTFYIAT